MLFMTLKGGGKRKWEDWVFSVFLYEEETLAFVLLRRYRGRKEISAFFFVMYGEKNSAL